MTVKLTLSVDKDVVERAKRYAASRNASVSSRHSARRSGSSVGDRNAWVSSGPHVRPAVNWKTWKPS